MDKARLYGVLERRWTALVLALAAAVSAVTFLRFLLTPLGLESLGRDWGYYVSYADFGFIRRGLIGTMTDAFVRHPVANDHLVPLVLYPLFMVAVAVAAFVYVRRLGLPKPRRDAYLALLMLSPAFLAHYAYSTGDFNVVLALIFVSTMMVFPSLAAALLLLVAAMLVHEIYIFAFAPAVCVAFYERSGGKLGKAALYGLAAIALAGLIAAFGVPRLSYGDYLAILHRHAPNLSSDGYFEMSSGIGDNLRYAAQLYREVRLWILVLPAILYWAILLVVFLPAAAPARLKALYVAAGTTPFVLFAFGSDLYRWTCFACVAVIVLGGFLAGRGYASLFTRRPWLALALTLPWILPGPFGSGCDKDRGGCHRLYPMAQFALEKVG